MNKKVQILIVIIILLILLIIWYAKFRNKESINNLIIFNLFNNSSNSFQFNISSKVNQKKSANLYGTFNAKSLSEHKIAPGTSGEFEILLVSAIDTNYRIKFESKNEKPQNLTFSIKDNPIKYHSLEDLGKYLLGSLNKNEKIKIIIEWSWNYETDTFSNIQDTLDGQKLEKYNFDINVMSY